MKNKIRQLIFVFFLMVISFFGLKTNILATDYSLYPSEIITMPSFVVDGTKIVFDSSGNKYLINDYHQNAKVLKKGVGSSEWVVIAVGGTGVGQFTNPVDIAVDPAGNVYVVEDGYSYTRYYNVSSNPNAVQKYNPQTNTWVSFATAGGGQQSDISEEDVSGIAVDKEYNVYVTTNGREIYRYSISTHEWSLITDNYSVGNTQPGVFADIAGIVFDDDNNVYVGDGDEHDRIQKYDVGTTTWTFFGVGVTGISMDYLAIDKNGDFYFIGSASNFYKYNQSTVTLSVISDVNRYTFPKNAVSDNNGDIYIVDYYDKVEKYNVDTTSWSLYEDFRTQTNQLSSPTGIAVDNNGNIYVVDNVASQIKKYNIGTTTWTVFAIGGTGVGQFDWPYAIDIDNNTGHIYVAEEGTHGATVGRVQEYNGSSWSVIGNNFDNPHGITVDNLGNVYVTESWGDKIQKYNVGTTTWSVIGTSEDVYEPASIAADNLGNVYIIDSDRTSNRIQKYNGSSWEVIGVAGTGVGQFNNPLVVNVDNQNNVYVSDYITNYALGNTSRIQKYDGNSWKVLNVSSYGTGGYSGESTSSLPNGTRHLTIDNSGNIFVVDTQRHRIHELIYSSVPSIPTGIGVTAGNGQVILNWTVPNYGGSVITGYTFYVNGVGTTTNSLDTTKIITGLTNGQSYSFNVSATNSFGIGATSSTVTATPLTTPGIPTGIGATAGNGQVILNWIAPLDTGGTTVTDYQIDYKLSIGNSWTTFADGVSSNTNSTVNGLANGTSYDFRVSAINVKGIGSPSETVAAIPVTTPGIPTGIGATAGNTKITLHWVAPDNGGTAINGYIFYVDGVGVTTNSIDTTKIITGLTNGHSYSFSVSATNSVGAGDTSTTISATPTETIPGSPTGVGVTVGDAQVTLNWIAPTDDGGASITSYQIEYMTTGVGWTNLTTSVGTTKNITGLINYQSYSFRVSAINSVGVGATSTTVTAIPIPPPVSIGATEISTLFEDEVFVIPVGQSQSSTNEVTVTNDVFINIGGGDTASVISLTKDTEITTENGVNFDASLISAMAMSSNSVSNLPYGFISESLIQWGIPGVTLLFSQPVEISMYLGDSYNGQTLSILRSLSLSSAWTSDGLVNTTCLISSGYCNFYTNKASYFTVNSYQPPINNSQQSNNSSSNNNSYVCNDRAATVSPDLFEMKVNKGKVNLIYSSSSPANSYAVLYGLKKGDERFGAIIPTINNNEGVQNGDIFMLNPKTTYWFKIAAINGCNIGPWSEWVSVKADRKRTVYKYMAIIKDKVKTLINKFK